MKELQVTDHDYKIIKKCRKCDVFPKVYWRGIRNGQMCSIEELVGPNLHEVFTKYQQNSFSISTIALIGLQILKKLQSLHKVGVTHNGLTPNKVLLSYNISDTSLYLIGLRSCRKITKTSKLGDAGPVNEKPIPVNKFSSITVHLGGYPTKKDDLESLFYLLSYLFLGGKLWENSKEKDKTLLTKQIEKAKLQLTPELFCQHMPKEMVEVFKYIKGLQASEKPDYMKLNKLLRSILVSNTTSKIIRYDWMERAALHLEKTMKNQQVSKANSGGSDEKTSAENKNTPLGAIDIDKDQNFAMDGIDSDDDESNIDESDGSEIVHDLHDSLPKSIARINEVFNASFIKDIGGSEMDNRSPAMMTFKKKPTSP